MKRSLIYFRWKIKSSIRFQSEGWIRIRKGFLLIQTTDSLSHQLLSPKRHVPKTYFAAIDGEVTEADVEAFKDGVTLDDGYETKPGNLNDLKSAPHSEIEL